MKIALTDGGKGCNSFTHMYQNPNVLECKKILNSNTELYKNSFLFKIYSDLLNVRRFKCKMYILKHRFAPNNLLFSLV